MKKDSHSPQTLYRFPFLRLRQFRSRVSPGGNHDWHLWQQQQRKKWVDRRRDGPFSRPALSLELVSVEPRDARQWILLLCRSTLNGVGGSKRRTRGDKKAVKAIKLSNMIGYRKRVEIIIILPKATTEKRKRELKDAEGPFFSLFVVIFVDLISHSAFRAREKSLEFPCLTLNFRRLLSYSVRRRLNWIPLAWKGLSPPLYLLTAQVPGIITGSPLGSPSLVSTLLHSGHCWDGLRRSLRGELFYLIRCQ